MVYKINVRNHLSALTSFFIITLLMIGVVAYFDFNYSALKIFGIFYLVNVLPTIYLHLEYYLYNRNESYELSENAIIRYKNGDKLSLSVEDIKSITIYMTPGVYRRSNFHLFSFEGYHYAEIVSKDGKKMIVSSLISPQLENLFNSYKMKFVRKRMLPATIFWNE